MNWSEYSSVLLEKCKKSETPFSCSFELTPLCNFRCNMRYVRLSPQQAAVRGSELTTDQWLNVGKKAKELGTVTLEITGGEALTRHDFPTLYEAFADMGFLIVLRTNGYLLTSKTLALLKRKKPYKIVITLYGASDSTYEKVCKVTDGFTVVSQNILALKEAGLDVHLTTTITKENECDVEPMLRGLKSTEWDWRYAACYSGQTKEPSVKLTTL